MTRCPWQLAWGGMIGVLVERFGGGKLAGLGSARDRVDQCLMDSLYLIQDIATRP